MTGHLRNLSAPPNGISVKFHRPEFVDSVCAFGFELDAEWIDAVWQYGRFLFVRR